MAKKLKPMHPGEVLREEFLIPLGLSAGALAKTSGYRARGSNGSPANRPEFLPIQRSGSPRRWAPRSMCG